MDGTTTYQLPITTSVRPKRVAFLFDPARDGAAEIDEAVRWNVGRWGGRYNTIVPTDGNVIADEWWLLLLLTDPDVVFSFRPLGEDLFQRIVRELLPCQIIETTDKDRERLSSGHLVRSSHLSALGIDGIPRKAWEARLPIVDPLFVSIYSRPASGVAERMALHNFGTVSEVIGLDPPQWTPNSARVSADIEGVSWRGSTKVTATSSGARLFEWRQSRGRIVKRFAVSSGLRARFCTTG